MADISRTRMTSEEFRELPETTQIVELIDGEMIVSPTPVDAHQRAILSLLRFLFQVVSTGTLRVAPLSVFLSETDALEPDIFWVRDSESRCHLRPDGYWYGPPDLVIEVLSPSTAKRDRGTKFKLYERYGVGEYWLIDPEAQFVEVFRQDGGHFVQQGLYGLGEPFVSLALGGIAIEPNVIFS